MNPITFPLQPGQQGPPVADLQDALLFLISHQVIKTFPAPNRPTVEELQALTEGLKLERTRSNFGNATARLVRHFQNQQALGDHLAVVEATTAAAINKLLTDLGVLTPSPTFEVSGRVYTGDRAGVDGLRVQVVDKNAGPDVVLAEGATDNARNFTLSFTTTALPQGKSVPDLQVRVLNGDVLLGASDVRYNATPSETLDVILPAAAADALPSEHTALTGAIAAHFNGKLADLQESDNPGERQDITYLANKTGWDARAVALAALADQFSATTALPTAPASAIPASFFYALFRAGLPANEDILYRTDAKSLETIWNKAAEQGVIPSSITNTIPAMVRQFQSLNSTKLLTGPALTGVSSLQELLASSNLNDAQQQQFASIYAANRTDVRALWSAVGTALGQGTAARLQLDGKLAFLTMNNAPLMQALHGVAGAQGLSDPVQLARAGFHRAEKWGALLNANIPLPNEIPGDTPEAKRTNYAELLAAQVRLSYPTAAVAEMVKSGDLPVDAPAQVNAFLTKHQGKFEIGVHPVEQFIARNNIQVAPETVDQIKRLQRVYQITPSDQAMAGLLKRGIDAAYHVVRFEKETFVERFAPDLGGAHQAALVYDKSQQVHNATLNIAISYLTAKNGVALGTSPMVLGTAGLSNGGQVLRPAPSGPTADNPDVIAYPTLESLFGSMDFCACDHCRSVLSPAAYLVDLLHFIDRDPAETGKENPQAVLLERRPDIQHLPLTCENTNTPLPYIDVVNETLEYFIANSVQELSLKEYTGHDTSGVASEDLMASPQFVMDTAYTILRNQRFPTPLPFHQPLENLRRYFDKLEAPLPWAMERLRKTDDLERGTNPYGWRDILMENIGLSREEHEILTDSAAVPLRRMYGFATGTADADVIAALSNAKLFARRAGISNDELVSLLRTRFINPNGDLIPKLERLGVPFATLKGLHDGTITDAEFDALLPTGAGTLDPAQYGGDIKAWVKKPDNFSRIMAIITLADPSSGSEPYDFDRLELRHARPSEDPADTSTRLNSVEYVRLLRFIRLWRKTGWTIEQTDAAICALYRQDLAPLAPQGIDTIAKLDAGFLTLVPRLGIVVRVIKALNLKPDRDLLPLLACWSNICTYGDHSLYGRMFLNPSILKQDSVFADDGFGNFLKDPTKRLADHADALRAAFHISAEEFDRIFAALGFGGATPLTLSNITAIYRRGWLARKLRLSVRELLLLASLTGLDPFGLPDPTHPAMLRLIELVQAMKDRSLKSAAALYLIWNQDLSGKSRPDAVRVSEFARTLRGDFASIDDQFAVTEDPAGDIARTRMALVYGRETADAFFVLLENAVVLDIPYTHTTSALKPAIAAIDANLVYDDFRHRLSHMGLLPATSRDALKAVSGVTAAFRSAVDTLFARGEDLRGSFLARHPELEPLYDAFVASTDPPEKKRSALLAAFRPELAGRRKREQALQRLSASASVDISLAQNLLDPEMAPYPLHAAEHTDQPALNDVIALETPGLAAQFFFRDTATGVADVTVPAAANLDYSKAGPDSLPKNPTPGGAISGIWQGRVETPEAGYYNIVIEADAGATVSLTFAGAAQTLTQNGAIRRNANPLQLKGGTLYDIKLTVEKVKERLSIQWETPKRPREVIPGRYLYPPTILAPFNDAYIRFLKTTSLAAALRLTGNEIAHFATDSDYQVNGDGWLNALAVSGDPMPSTAAALLRPFEALLEFARINAHLSPDDEQLLGILQDPTAATATAESQLFTLTRWDRASLDDVLTQFGSTIAGLSHFDLFRRVHDAFAVIRRMGVSGAALIRATTNAPDGGIVRDFQAALRARFADSDWRDLIQPINDTMRSLQRDALVASILHQMRESPATSQIDTPDKLFEYFLMDVQMEPCMLTSRIRHALSSVQLFAERCLMNLETRVSPSSINANQWTWMKRYRVWEANRKVFLWPENWLEPELRDDKTPFFKEIESELLQSDITEDLAAGAMLNYLAKLEEVAKLEPCGLHYEEPTDTRGEVLHLVARTAGAHRKYYYRRYQSGYWTPLEQIKLDIEDNPVIPYVWNDRLLLFWLRLLKKGPDLAAKPAGGRSLTTITTNDLPPDPPVRTQAVLCWSEYYNGQWQAAKTSDLNLPTTLDTSSPGVFDRAKIRLGVAVEGDALRLYIKDTPIRPLIAGVDIETWPGSFLFYNTHSLPVCGETAPVAQAASASMRRRELTGAKQEFAFRYRDPTGADSTRSILRTQLPFDFVGPRHELKDIWRAPVFIADSRHVFLVSSEEQPVRVHDFGGYGTFVNPDTVKEAQIPTLVVPAAPPQKPTLWTDGSAIAPDRNVVDTESIRRFVTEDAYIRQGLGSTLTVIYRNLKIGPSGSNGSLER
ncbi:MAG TPA: neuraminidase-like domain-containing protein [Acidobacteriota bacterium]